MSVSPPPPTAQPEPRRGVDRARVLVVDDEPSLRMLLGCELEDMGHDVDKACNGREARDLLASGARFDLVISDLRMPGMTGLELLAWIRANRPEIDVMLMTGFGSCENAAEGLRLGARDFLMKPFADLDLVAASIERVLEHRRLEGEARQLRRQLIHGDRLQAIGHMAAAVAHEINNPAGYALGNLAMLGEELDSIRERLVALGMDESGVLDSLEQCREMAEVSRDGVKRIAVVSRDLRRFGRADVDHAEMMSVPDIVQTAVRIARMEIRHRAELVVDIGQVPMIRGHPGRLAQVFINLLVNAAQAIDAGDARHNLVKITCHLEDGHVVVGVADTGRGMTDAERAHAFEAFFTTKPYGEGTGLGLSLAADIVAQHGGRISVESAPGQGTSLHVWLPVHSELTPSTPPSRPMGLAAGPAPRPRVLIIDDEPLLQRAFITMLGPAWDCHVDDSAEEVIARLESGDCAWDAIVLDLMLPGIDGAGLHRRIVADYPHLEPRIVFTTGGATTASAKEFASHMDERTIYKPCTSAELLAAVEAVAEASREVLGV